MAVERLLGGVYWGGKVCLVHQFLEFGDLQTVVEQLLLSPLAKVIPMLNFRFIDIGY